MRAAIARQFTVWIFAVLCVLVGSRWLIEAVLPNSGSTELTEAAGCIMAAGLAALPVVFRRVRSRASSSSFRPAKLSGTSALALVGPALGASVAGRHVNGNNATLALALTPAVIAVALSARSHNDSGELTGRLWPGLAGLAGLLLLLPQPSLDSWRFLLALGLMPLLTGLGAAFSLLGPRSPQEPARGDAYVDADPQIVISLLIAGVLFAILTIAGGLTQSLPFSLSAAALDGLIFLLSLVVLARLGAVRWAAQFLLVPLLTMLEGAVVLRPVLDVRSWLGFALLAVSGGYLLYVGRGDSIAQTS